MTELKKCPFCGGIARVYCDDGVRVMCIRCGCRTPVRKDAPEEWIKGLPLAVDVVIAEWNRRAE